MRRRIQRRQPLDRDISIHAPLAGCDVHLSALIRSAYWISIHAPLAGCDYDQQHKTHRKYNISIHAPLAGCDARPRRTRRVFDRFQSTHPLRGATHQYGRDYRGQDISIHAPLAGCDPVDLDGLTVLTIISIHAPLAGCDLQGFLSFQGNSGFQSTHPLRGATP